MKKFVQNALMIFGATAALFLAVLGYIMYEERWTGAGVQYQIN